MSDWDGEYPIPYEAPYEPVIIYNHNGEPLCQPRLKMGFDLTVTDDGKKTDKATTS